MHHWPEFSFINCSTLWKFLALCSFGARHRSEGNAEIHKTLAGSLLHQRLERVILITWELFHAEIWEENYSTPFLPKILIRHALCMLQYTKTLPFTTTCWWTIVDASRSRLKKILVEKLKKMRSLFNKVVVDFFDFLVYLIIK